MNGRLYNNEKISCEIENKLKNYPDFVSGYYYNMRASNKELTSCREYLFKVINFLESINNNISDVKPGDITKTNVTKYMISIQTKEDKDGNITETSDSYQLMIWYALRNFFDYLKRNELIKYNYILDISKPKNNDLQRINSNRKLLTEADFNKILSSVKRGVAQNKQLAERDLAIMLLFMTTGMRRAALSEINLNDIDFENCILKVTDKGNKFQEYYLSRKIINVIKLWINKRNTIKSIKDNDALFISNNGNRLTGRAIYNLVNKYCEDALGYKVSPHKLRSGFCSIMYKETGDIEKVRRMVGHANIATTQRYIVTDNKERMESSKIMDSKLHL